MQYANRIRFGDTLRLIKVSLRHQRHEKSDRLRRGRMFAENGERDRTKAPLPPPRLSLNRPGPTLCPCCRQLCGRSSTHNLRSARRPAVCLSSDPACIPNVCLPHRVSIRAPDRRLCPHPTARPAASGRPLFLPSCVRMFFGLQIGCCRISRAPACASISRKNNKKEQAVQPALFECTPRINIPSTWKPHRRFSGRSHDAAPA